MINVETALSNMLWDARKGNHQDLIWYFSREVEQAIIKARGKPALRNGEYLADYRDLPVSLIVNTYPLGFCAILGESETTWAIGLTLDGEIRKLV